MSAPWIATHRDAVQRLVNALVKALRFIAAHDAQEIAAQLPADYMAGDRALYVGTLQQSKSMFTPDGVMPASGPANVLRVMRAAERAVVDKPIDLSRTFTTEFARAAR
jgi:NitT/TauT family transport system substrate-binding protein